MTRHNAWHAGIAVLAVGLAVTSRAANAGQQPPPQRLPPAAAPPVPPSPVELAHQAERRRIMRELKISAIPPGAVGTSLATYNEADANPYPDLPDPLLLKNGQKVTSARAWRSRRRVELLEDFQREIYGRRPKNVPKVRWTVVRTVNETQGEIPAVTKQTGGHTPGPTWPTFLAFASRYLDRAPTASVR